MANEAVYDFLKEHNRPFSLNDIISGVGKDHGKAAVQKSLDKLVNKQKVIMKTYGKQNIYCVAQDAVDAITGGDGLRKIEQEISEFASNLKTVEEKLHTSTLEMNSLENKMTTEKAVIERDGLLKEVASLKMMLNDVNDEKPISAEEKNKINVEYERLAKEYKKRKRMCMDIINAILEGYPKTKAHLFEDIGIETDEDVGFRFD